VAASDHWEVVTLFTDASNGVTESTDDSGSCDPGNTVQALPVSAILPADEPVHIVKLDIEGSEGKALRGMKDSCSPIDRLSSANLPRGRFLTARACRRLSICNSSTHLDTP